MHFRIREHEREKTKRRAITVLSLYNSLYASTPFANISIDSPFICLCGVLGVGVNLPAGDSSSDSSGTTSLFKYRYNSMRKCAGGRKPLNDHFGESSPL